MVRRLVRIASIRSDRRRTTGACTECPTEACSKSRTYNPRAFDQVAVEGLLSLFAGVSLARTWIPRRCTSSTCGFDWGPGSVRRPSRTCPGDRSNQGAFRLVERRQRVGPLKRSGEGQYPPIGSLFRSRAYRSQGKYLLDDVVQRRPSPPADLAPSTCDLVFQGRSRTRDQSALGGLLDGGGQVSGAPFFGATGALARPTSERQQP